MVAFCDDGVAYTNHQRGDGHGGCSHCSQLCLVASSLLPLLDGTVVRKLRVVLSINLPMFGKTWALPVLFRLYRSNKRCKVDKKPYRKTTELARELVELLAKTLPHRRIVVLGDAAYTNSSLIKKRPSNVSFIGRSRLDAALYAPAPQRRKGQMGRPRVRGSKLPSPGTEARDKTARWRRTEVTVYGKTVLVRKSAHRDQPNRHRERRNRRIGIGQLDETVT